MSTERRILFYNPYLSTLGGGERYHLTVAAAVRRHADIVFAAPNVPDPSELERFRLPADLPFVSVPHQDLTSYSAGFDSLVYLTNDIPQRCEAQRAYLIVQFPFETRSSRADVDKWRDEDARLGRYRCVVYSRFVRQWLMRRWRRYGTIIPPAVELRPYEESTKENVVLAVARFFSADGHTKRQDVLIDAFKALPRDLRETWRLILVGRAHRDEESAKYLARLQDSVADTPEIIVSPDLPASQLDELTGKAKLFWHAAGYPARTSPPEWMEHFGMATVEAMSAGAVPLVHNAGGQREVVTRKSGVTWTTVDELVAQSRSLMRNEDQRQRMSAVAHQSSQQYGSQALAQGWHRLLQL